MPRGTQAAHSPSLWSGLRRSRLGSAALLFTLLAGIPVRAEFIYRQVNLAYLTQRADVIVQGRVVGVRYEGLPGYPNVPTVLVTLEVERMLRGPAGKQYTFREFLLPANRARGKRGYAVGQRLLLFLPEPSQYGLSSPLGGEQGRFRIQPDQKGNEVITNGFGNLGLFNNVAKSAAQAGLSLSSDKLRVPGTARGPVPLDDFVSLVEQLAAVPKFQ
jgi:hypothetical protein